MLSRRTHVGLGGVVVVVAALLACSQEAPRPPDARRDEEAGPSPAVTRLDETIRRAMAWTATLDVDPLRLREENGMKGIKHMVEFLNFHHVVYRWSGDPDVRRTARERALGALRVTNDDPGSEQQYRIAFDETRLGEIVDVAASDADPLDLSAPELGDEPAAIPLGDLDGDGLSEFIFAVSDARGSAADLLGLPAGVHPASQIASGAKRVTNMASRKPASTT